MSSQPVPAAPADPAGAVRPLLYLRAAEPADAELLARWRTEAAAWVAGRSASLQWSGPDRTRRRLRMIEAGATVLALLEPDGPPVATCSLWPRGGTRRWTAEERAVPARYLRASTVDRAYAGLGIGRLLHLWAGHRAAADGAAVLRLDARTDNPALHRYYRSCGWHLVRTVPGLGSGALFETPAVLRPDLPVRELGAIRLPR
ncbi:GNAT family N-acetyltransferase [Kitasatospora sp. CM 4170]|uniref:GNAT family N-acetyltransferase n=1 Tax=Kitasatospora aburaviensis TaxID=67265 RepID=A0ABW1EWX7_9ACTN|nr:GNAT family N-acetyltransferase [Kitasatospora sp. CM 4170]WNM43778.1 GNAT family N-acetyltransferase [Kitasatospora sp. CM 4170]